MCDQQSLRSACTCAQSDQSLCKSLEYAMTEHHLECLSFKGGCTGSYESTLVKMPHCWKSYAAAQISCAQLSEWWAKHVDLWTVSFSTYYRRTPDTKHTMGWKFAWGLGLLTGLWMWWGLYTEFDHIKVRLAKRDIEDLTWTDFSGTFFILLPNRLYTE